MNKKIPIIFLVSYGHSGSTLLDLIFDSHPEIIGVGELCQYFVLRDKDFLCNCGKGLDQCEFWLKVFENISQEPDLRIARNKIDFLLNRNNYFYYDKKRKISVDLKEYFKKQTEIYKRILLYSNKKIIFDSSKRPHLAESLFLNDKLDVFLIHLVRDGRGVLYSYRKSYPKRSAFSIAYQWLVTNLKIGLIKIRHPKKNIFVRYEDFVREPEKILRKIFNRLNIEYESSILKFDEKIHHQAGGNVNARFYREKNSQIKEDIKWKSRLSFKDKFIFNLFFGWLNFYYQKIKKL